MLAPGGEDPLAHLSTPAGAVPFSRSKFRVAALVFDGEDVALIRRARPAGTRYTTIGGNVEPGEHLLDALARELGEELYLSMTDASTPELCWIQDQMVTRPGGRRRGRGNCTWSTASSSAPRCAPSWPPWSTASNRTAPQEPGYIEWVSYRKLGGGFPLFPLIGDAIAALPSPKAPVAGTGLPPVTDENCTWV